MNTVTENFVKVTDLTLQRLACQSRYYLFEAKHCGD